ncbi:hypothetical protein M758_UG249400 [Ceratodon purpureus]|nr:hypothetical protein M758_UG249400 [Ceratodon purpureus]
MSGISHVVVKGGVRIGVKSRFSQRPLNMALPQTLLELALDDSTPLQTPRKRKRKERGRQWTKPRWTKKMAEELCSKLDDLIEDMARWHRERYCWFSDVVLYLGRPIHST